MNFLMKIPNVSVSIHVDSLDDVVNLRSRESPLLDFDFVALTNLETNATRYYYMQKTTTGEYVPVFFQHGVLTDHWLYNAVQSGLKFPGYRLQLDESKDSVTMTINSKPDVYVNIKSMSNFCFFLVLTTIADHDELPHETITTNVISKKFQHIQGVCDLLNTMYTPDVPAPPYLGVGPEPDTESTYDQKLLVIANALGVEPEEIELSKEPYRE